MSLIEDAFRYQPPADIPVALIAGGILVAAIALVGFAVLFWFSQE
jgi:hypothetical protein